MKSIRNTLLAALVLCCLAAGTALALEVPKLTKRVTDLAGMISPGTARALEAQLARLEQTDSTQVAILTVPSLEGENLEAYSIKVVDNWALGQKGKDNGVLLLVSKADRKIRIEVGYGLEGVLTDVLSGQIIDNVITPRFRNGAFDAGFTQGVEAITRAVRGEYKAKPGTKKEARGKLTGIIFAVIFFIIMMTRGGRGILLPLLIMGSLGGRHPRSGGGFGSGGFGGGGFGGGGGGFGGGGASGGW